MADIGIVRGVGTVGTGYRGDQVLIVPVEIDDPLDIQSVEYLFSAGESFIPPVGSEVLIHTISDEQKVATSCDMSVVTISGLNPGDRRIFAVSDGSVKGMIDILGTGEVVINSGTGYGVEFTKLKEAFDSLVASYNGHVHTGTVSGATCAVIATTNQSTASVDGAKVEKLRV